jgi:hypothetical protein
MKKTILILTALASLTIANAKAEYYNFDVNVHQDDLGAALQYLHQRTEEMKQQFYSEWVYTLNKVQRSAYFNAVPGLRAALAHNDWPAACSFYIAWRAQEDAYEKRYHACSPGFLAACRAARIQYGLERK